MSNVFKRGVALAIVSADLVLSTGLGHATSRWNHHRVHGPHRAQVHAFATPRATRRGERQPYAATTRATPTCRYADGTPYDPDIIGGPNHVGDGGPAGNLGGLDPCGY